MLSDEQRRRVYDQTGATGDQHADFANEDFFRGFSGFQSAGFDESIFASFAEMFGQGQGRGARGKAAGSSITLNAEIDFAESVQGTEKVLGGAMQTVSYNRVAVCGSCQGSKAKPGTKATKCSTCQGKGSVN